ncbi:MAG TPA: hypothetical protein VMV69_28765, partial [Pirellulales bacterium]|nr:hypothetical protein [Pirellulales bacterium]
PSGVRNRDRPAAGPIGGQCSDFAEKCEPNGPFWRAAVASPRARHRGWACPHVKMMLDCHEEVVPNLWAEPLKP